MHLRTTNPIESAFATIRHRSDRAKGCVTRATMLAFMFKLATSAEESFRKLKGFAYLAKVIAGVRFVDGVEQIAEERGPNHPPPLVLMPAGAEGLLDMAGQAHAGGHTALRHGLCLSQ